MEVTLSLAELLALIAVIVGPPMTAVTVFWVQVGKLKASMATREDLAKVATELAVGIGKANERMDRFRHREAHHTMWFGAIFTKLGMEMPREHDGAE
jgi:tetrahydromethanopterin S-methyltransferase subunit D